MRTFKDIVEEARLDIKELDPDNVEEMLAAGFCSTMMHPDRRTIVDD